VSHSDCSYFHDLPSSQYDYVFTPAYIPYICSVEISVRINGTHGFGVQCAI